MHSEDTIVKAAVRDRYGPPEVIELRDVPKPVPGDGEVLIAVRAASVNSWDWDQLVGNLQGRLDAPSRPKHAILGADVAGVVEAVGPGVTRFRVGDEVFGDIAECGWGGFAEYVAARADLLVAKPAGMSFVQAAAIPQAGLLALQGLRLGAIEAGDEVLINGAGGGFGSFAIQIAKQAGAVVTGVDHTSKLEFMRAAGADRVIDYTRENFAAGRGRYDFILDGVARHGPMAYLRRLKPGGRATLVGGRTPMLLAAVTAGALMSALGSRKIGLLIWRPSPPDIEEMARLFAAGTVVPKVERTYPLSDTAEALRHVGEGRAMGKIVVTIGA